MPENIRAVIWTLALLVPTLLLLRPQLTALAIEPVDYRRRAAVWFVLTVALFVSHNFWLFMAIAAVTLLVAGIRDSNALAFYLFVLVLAPPFQSTIQGFAGISQFIAIDYLRLLSLVVLLPLSIRLSRDPDRARLFGLPADKYLLAYLALQIAITSTVTSATDVLRTTFAMGIDVALPYYVCSRGLTNVRQFRDAFTSLAAAGVILAVFGIFENLKGWLLYSSLPNFLDVQWAMGGYMLREGSLRASATTGHSIILGYVLVIALGLHLSLRSSWASRRAWMLAGLVLLGGIVATYARGPWVGALATLIAAWALSPGVATKAVKPVVGLAVAAALVAMTPLGTRIMAVLPFVGTADNDSVDYRQRLFQVSWDVLMMNPVFGSPYYLQTSAMEQMRQGEGIIDMVNSYLGVAMYSGFVGLTLFAAVFLCSAIRIVPHLWRHADKEGEQARFGVGLMAALAGALVTIATASSINVVPYLYWCLAGACAAYWRWALREATDPTTSLRADPPWHRRAPMATGQAGWR